MKRHKRSYRLPSGEFTGSCDKYIRAWRKLAKPIAAATGSTMLAYDPGILFSKNGRSWDMETDIALALYDALTKR